MPFPIRYPCQVPVRKTRLGARVPWTKSPWANDMSQWTLDLEHDQTSVPDFKVVAPTSGDDLHFENETRFRHMIAPKFWLRDHCFADLPSCPLECAVQTPAYQHAQVLSRWVQRFEGS